MPALLIEPRARRLRRAAFLLVVTATLLGGCGRGAETDDSQVAVRVNKGEISTHQIQAVLQRQPRLLAEQPDTAAKRVLEVLIDQELAAQAGREQGLESDPAVVQSMEAARREVLARAYQERIAAKAVAPSTDEVDRYYASRPALFAQRRLYTLQETVVDVTDAQREAVEALVQRARGAEELGTSLRLAGFGTRTRQLTQAAEDLPLHLVDAIAKLEVGGSLWLPQPGSARIFTLLQAQSAPVDRATANSAIVNFLTKERQRELVAQSTEALRKSGSITYQGAFAKAPAAPASSASAVDAKPLMSAAKRAEAGGLAAGPNRAEPLWPAGLDPIAAAIVLVGLASLYLPMFQDWAEGRWAAETQGHEAIILSIVAWLLFRKRAALMALPDAGAARGWGAALLVVGLLVYVVGRTQEIVRLELLSLTWVVAALLLWSKGFAAWRLTWFPFLFTLFALPLPYSLVLTLTAPMKTAVSIVATQLLQWLGYPTGRSGVVMTIGQYQLLVTEACAGLQTMFTLEAMGLLYASLMNHASALRNVLLSVLVVPVAFSANVVRVMVLALVTYYFGDAAGQGFLHGFAGIVLFVVALVFIMGVDALLGRLLGHREARP